MALETTQALVAFLAAGLMSGRFLRTSDRRDLFVVAGLCVLGSVAAVRAGLPLVRELISGDAVEAVSRWVPLGGQVVAVGLLVFAALSSAVTVRRRRSAGLVLGAAGLVSLGVVAGLLAVGDWLPQPFSPADPLGAHRPRFDVHPVLVGVQLVLVAGYGLVAWAFAWRSDDRAAEPVIQALAVGAVLAAASRVNFVLYPADWLTHVHVADLFRVGFYATLAVGAALTIRQSWHAEVAAADLFARERLAREMHDGLAQELNFIASQASSLASGRADAAALDHVALAAERARFEARRVVDALAGEPPRPVTSLIAQAAAMVADRDGVEVRISGDESLVVDGRVGHELAQVVREATSNAVRHGAATVVDIDVELVEDELRLRVLDDGRGFDRARVHGKGFGLRSMEQRALQLGGRLVVESRPGHGSAVELAAPVSGLVMTPSAGGRSSGEVR